MNIRKFAVYYDVREGKYFEKCGSDSVAVLDGRYGLDRLKDQAREIGMQRFGGRRWPWAFRLARGSRFSEPFFFTDFYRGQA